MAKVFSVAKAWNEQLEKAEERKLKPRANMWASELGGSYIDRYLKMQGVPFTNPPNVRSRRKFEAGNFIEWVIGVVLKRAGIFMSAQDWVSFAYPGLLEVTGKIDYIVGGKPKWDESIHALEELELPELFNRSSQAIVESLKKELTGDEVFEEMPIEVKSCSSFMFDKFEADGQPNQQHALQLFHYLKSKDLPRGIVLYVCKDDLRLLEFVVLNPSPIEDIYRNDIQTMSEYWFKQEEPPLEPLLTFDGQRFKTNFKVEYSYYLTKLYGFKEPADYTDKYKRQMSSWNAVMTRIKAGKPMTAKNLAYIEEMRSMFPEIKLDIKEEADVKPKPSKAKAKTGAKPKKASGNRKKELR